MTMTMTVITIMIRITMLIMTKMTMAVMTILPKREKKRGLYDEDDKF